MTTEALEFGRIVWAEITDSQGNRKERPAIILTPTHLLTTSSLIGVVAVTSTIIEPVPDDYVLLPWHPQGRVRTRLKRRCAAVCSWLVRIAPSDIRELGGIVPGSVLLEIVTKVAVLRPGT